MSSFPSPPEQHPIHPILWTAFGLCLTCVVVVGVLLATNASTDNSNSPTDIANSNPTRFAPLTIDTARLLRERREQQSEAQLGEVDRELSHLYSVVIRANQAQFPPQDSQTQPDPVLLAAEVTFAADEVLPASGVRGFTAAGEPIFAACNEGIEELLKAIRIKNVSLAEAKENPPLARFKKYRENCGNALPMLLQHGLVTPDGRWAKPYAATLFDILNRYRWAHIAHARLPARLQLAPYEYELLMRWRIEDPDAFSTNERKQFIAQAAAEIRDYDSLLAETLLENESKDRTQAVEHLRNLSEKHPTNQNYRRRYQRALQFDE